SDPEPLHGALCWPPGGYVHYPGSPPVGDEHEPRPHLRVGVVGSGMDRALDLLPGATPRHAPGGGTVCAFAWRAPGIVRKTAPSQHLGFYQFEWHSAVDSGDAKVVCEHQLSYRQTQPPTPCP